MQVTFAPFSSHRNSSYDIASSDPESQSDILVLGIYFFRICDAMCFARDTKLVSFTDGRTNEQMEFTLADAVGDMDAFTNVDDGVSNNDVYSAA